MMNIFTIKTFRWLLIIALFFILKKLMQVTAEHRINQAKKGKFDNSAKSYFKPDREADSTYRLASSSLRDMGGDIVYKKNEGEYHIIADLKKQGHLVIFKALQSDGGTDFTVAVKPRTFILIYYFNIEATLQDFLHRIKI